MWGSLVMKRKNWTSPGPDGVQNFWLKRIKVLWAKEVEYVNDILEERTIVPKWMGGGRTVLLPKTNDISQVDKYRPITCLNTLYKMVTAVIADDIQEHLISNKLWDGQQKGTQKRILGTMDNLLVDRAILEESKEYERNLSVAYYDYEKAFDSTPHRWQVECFKLCKINDTVIKILEQLQKIWHTRLEVWNNGELVRSPIIEFKRGFFQGDALSPVAFCITEIPLGIMLQRVHGYSMGEPNKRNTKVNRFYFIDDLKLVQGSEADLIRANEIVKTISNDTGMKFGISKCAEIVYKRGKMVRGEGLQLKEGLIRSLNPEQNEFYTFLGIEEGDGQLDKAVKQRVTEKCFSLVNKICTMELYERNLVKAVNSKAMATVRYSMNICHFTMSELKDLDIKMRKILLQNKVRGPEESLERMYMPREVGGRGFTSFEMMYKMCKISIAVYLCLTGDQMLRSVFRRERSKNNSKNSIKEAELAMKEVGHNLSLDAGIVLLDGKLMEGPPSKIRKLIPQMFKGWWREMLIREYESKVVQSVIWKEVLINPEGFDWMKKNITGQQVARILRMQEQMVPNKGLDKVRGKQIEDYSCRLCKKSNEGVKHWLNSCEYLAKVEYLKRHDQALRVFYAEVLKMYNFEPHEKAWYNIPVETIRENSTALVVWNVRIPTHTKVSHRWPDLRIEVKKEKVIYIVDMSCPSDGSVAEKEIQKQTNYSELLFDLKTQRQGWKIKIMPLVVGATGAINNLPRTLQLFFENANITKRCVGEMQKTTVIGSLQMIHRIECGLV